MNTLNYVDLVLLCSIGTFCVVYNRALSNLKNPILKFPKNMIITSLTYSH